MLLDGRKIPVFTYLYAEGTLQRPQFLEYFNFETGYMVYFGFWRISHEFVNSKLQVFLHQ